MRADRAGGWLRAFPASDAGRLLLVLAVAFAAYAGSLRGGFVWDDYLFIEQNPVLEELRNIPRFFVSGDAVGTYIENPYYRPLVTSSFAIDTALWGDSPAGFHAANLALHLGACAILFLVARRVSGRPFAAFAAAMLFAVHPANAEPVGYVSARADLACTLFALASFLFFLRDLERDTLRDRVLSNLAFLLALLSKISAGALLPLFAAWLLRAEGAKGRWPRLLPYGAIAFAYLALRGSVVELDAWVQVPLGSRILAAGPFLATYLRNAAFPFDLKTFYDLPLRTSLADGAVIGGWAATSAVAGAAALLWRRGRRAESFGLAWFLSALLPVSGIVMVLYPAHVADRYLYLPLAGLAIAAGSLADGAASGLSAGRTRSLAAASATALVAVLALLSSVRVAAWGDSVRLWTAAVKDAPGSGYVLTNYGAALRNASRYDEAEAALNRAIANGDESAIPRVNLACIALARGDFLASEAYIHEAIARDPGNPVARNIRGVVLANLHRYEEAGGCFREALRIWPRYENASANLRRLSREAAVAGVRSAVAD